MIIHCECCDLRLKHFEIVNFYDIETCFAWDCEKLVVFPYNPTTSTSKLSSIAAPKPIRSVHSYSGRVFILLKPCGIYKFNKNHEFVAFTSSAIGICTKFHEVLKLKENYLWLNNICEKTSKQLFKFSKVISTDKNTNELCTLVLTQDILCDSLKPFLSLENYDVCIIANGGKLFKLCRDNIQFIYACTYNIIDVSVVTKNQKIVGLLLKTDVDKIVLGFVNHNALCFKSINVNVTITTLIVECFDDNTISIIYSDSGMIHVVKYTIESDIWEKTSSRNEPLLDLKNYKGKILGLTTSNELVCPDFGVMLEKFQSIEMDNFSELKSSMLKGSEVIVENICAQTSELNACNEKLLIEQDKLKRINIYAQKQRMPHFPKIQVARTAGCLFLIATFDHPLPQNCRIFIALTCGDRTQFSSKLVDNREITVDMQLMPQMLESTLNISIDLITFSEENQPWCLVRNCIKKPTLRDRTKIRKLLSDKRNLLNAKFNALQSITRDGNSFDMKKLSNLKKSIRRDIPDL